MVVPPRKDASDEMWVDWIKQSEVSIGALIDVLGSDVGGNAACSTARNGIYGRDPEPSVVESPYTISAEGADNQAWFTSSGFESGFETAESDDDEEFSTAQNKLDIEAGEYVSPPQI